MNNINIQKEVEEIRASKVPVMFTLQEASECTRLPYWFLRQLCLQGKIVHVRAGKRYLINMQKLFDYLDEGDPA